MASSGDEVTDLLTEGQQAVGAWQGTAVRSVVEGSAHHPTTASRYDCRGGAAIASPCAACHQVRSVMEGSAQQAAATAADVERLLRQVSALTRTSHCASLGEVRVRALMLRLSCARARARSAARRRR